MGKIVFFDVHGEDKHYFKRTFKNVFSSRVECTDEPLTEVTAKKYTDATAISVFVTSDVNKKVFDKLPDLEFIATRSTGHDHIDVEAARTHHVLISNVPAYGEATVAEYTIMLLLALSRRLPESTQQVQDRIINYPEITGSDVCGKTIGLIGCGRIGSRVAQTAAALGMDVLGYDPYPDDDGNIKFVEMDELLKESDIVSLHAPSTKDSKHIINSDSLARMKKGVILLNTARGDLVDTHALVECLFSGHVAAAGLDVLEGEQLLRFDEEVSLLHPDADTQDLLLSAEHNALLRMSNVIITPHNAFNSKEALARIRHTTSENIKKYLMQEPQNIVGASK